MSTSPSEGPSEQTATDGWDETKPWYLQIPNLTPELREELERMGPGRYLDIDPDEEELPPDYPTSLALIDRPLDNTALAAFLACPQLYFLQYVRHYRSKGSRIALDYGSLWHTIMEWHYKSDGDETLTYAMTAKKWRDAIPATDDHRTFDRAWTDYELYRKKWGYTPSTDEQYKTIGFIQGNPLIEMFLNAMWPGAPYPYAGKIDRIAENADGEVIVDDHKTNSRDGVLGDWYFNQFQLDNQLIGYTKIASLVTGREVAGVRVNAYAVLKTKSSFARRTFRFGPELMTQWEEDYRHVVKELETAYRTGIWRRNYRACATKYGPCAMVEVCKARPDVKQRILDQDYVVRPWNPADTGNDGE